MQVAQVEQWIGTACPGKRFAEVGGLWGAINEKVTVAGKAGAASLTMIDIADEGEDTWDTFRARCAGAGLAGCRCISRDVNDPGLAEEVGRFDVVLCNGVLYHCPHPLLTVTRLGSLCRQTLLLGSTVIPPRLENEAGVLACDPGGALLVPALDDAQRRVVAAHFAVVGAAAMLGISKPCGWTDFSYTPWWWLFTVEHVQGLLEAVGFVVEEHCLFWGERAAYFRAERATPAA